MPETRLSLLQRTATIYMLYTRYGGLPFPPPLPYICFDRGTVFSHSQPPTLLILSPSHDGFSFPSPLIYICCARDTVVSNSHRHCLIHGMPEIRVITHSNRPFVLCYVWDTMVIHSRLTRLWENIFFYLPFVSSPLSIFYESAYRRIIQILLCCHML